MEGRDREGKKIMVNINELTRDERMFLQERKKLNLIVEHVYINTRGYKVAKKLEQRGLVKLEGEGELFGIYLTSEGERLYNSLEVKR